MGLVPHTPLLLDSSIKHYAWGSRDALPELLGIDNLSGQPFAELWIGAHPDAPSTVLDLPTGPLPLDALIQLAPTEVLGARVAKGWDATLPFLLKILAAAEPLSVQCHPDEGQALVGFHREDQAGIARDARHRNYRDSNSKPEMVVALSRFTALLGFRPPREICELFGRAGVKTMADEIGDLRSTGDLQAFYRSLCGLEPARASALFKEVERGTRGQGGILDWVRTLMRKYPGDIGALAPLYLHLVELSPGEGLYLPARELHSYLRGTAIEIMGNSDNVLRGGLTQKHIDVAELLDVLRFDSRAPSILTAHSRGDGIGWYDAPTAAFSLGHARVNAPITRADRDAVDILLCTSGEIEIVASGGTQKLPSGRAAMMAASIGDYRIAGTGDVWVATVP